MFGASDGVITFGSSINYDFDNSDGVTPGSFDFESVAAHEIGHILGFATAVDTVDFFIDTGEPTRSLTRRRLICIGSRTVLPMTQRLLVNLRLSHARLFPVMMMFLIKF